MLAKAAAKAKDPKLAPKVKAVILAMMERGESVDTACAVHKVRPKRIYEALANPEVERWMGEWEEAWRQRETRKCVATMLDVRDMRAAGPALALRAATAAAERLDGRPHQSVTVTGQVTTRTQIVIDASGDASVSETGNVVRVATERAPGLLIEAG